MLTPAGAVDVAVTCLADAVSGGAASSKKGNFTNSLSSDSNVCDMAKLRVIVDCRPADAAPNRMREDPTKV
eukprot:CAMPEP_0173118752 /NCGR_PEP_ID=MMETSP1102-20130122/51282_1 /TAXON_ID=49646 /ORGANISM="Geminigera sp., Strain Caron Lab Isolate" /LENGTH=70 /DNA_ID=CAMNT_0014024037 /DNA_START=494 /DNA_END=702 /DNA_ORIENTATION=-